jgi:hypothetical protein
MPRFIIAPQDAAAAGREARARLKTVIPNSIVIAAANCRRQSFDRHFMVVILLYSVGE